MLASPVKQRVRCGSFYYKKERGVFSLRETNGVTGLQIAGFFVGLFTLHITEDDDGYSTATMLFT